MTTSPDKPAPEPRKGGYYKDDGPGENPPADLAAIPDAEPRAEALHRFANRPYQVFGRDYVPLTASGPFRQRGVASWYGRRFHGAPTSSGEPYDMYGMTAAHPTLPIPSYARVTRVDTGRSVVVRVNDRGPFHAERVIDLSYTAAWKLGFAETGSALVDVEAVVPGESARKQPQNVYLQLGAFSARETAENFRARVYRELAWLSDTIQVIAAGALWRLHLGPYRSQDEARPIAERIRAELNVSPLLVVR
jgi:rare lipoprotein A